VAPAETAIEPWRLFDRLQQEGVIPAGVQIPDLAANLIHCPERLRLWIKMTLGPYHRVETFDTLQAALNSIRPVLLAVPEDDSS
jgi:hypothetical protein